MRKFIRMTEVFLILAVMLLVTSCGSNPPLPKKPRENKRIPINQTLPIEIEE